MGRHVAQNAKGYRSPTLPTALHAILSTPPLGDVAALAMLNQKAGGKAEDMEEPLALAQHTLAGQAVYD
eukprot:3239172-Ditylum_brightwellii.AAC.1